MILNYDKTITRCTVHSRCPICGSDGWCQLIGDDLVQCMRVEQGSFKTIDQSDGGTAYLHHLNGGTGSYSSPSQKHRTLPKKVAPIEERDRVYQALLYHLGLPTQHAERDHLHKRGLTDDQINHCGFGVFSARSRKPWKIAKDLENIWSNLLDVPGFVMAEREGNRYLNLALPKDSLLIPVRNDKGQIEAIKCRKAEGDPKYLYLSSKTRKWEGPSAVQTLHVPKGLPLDGNTIRVTEGPLKADVAWHLSGVPTVGIPSATSWRCLETLLEEYPNFTRVILSLDADFRTNRHVGRGLVCLCDLVLRLGREVILELWNAQHGKGIDDVLLAGAPIEKLHDPVSVIEPLRLQYPNKTETAVSVAGSVTPPSNSSPPSTPPGVGADLPIAFAITEPFAMADRFLAKHYRDSDGLLLLRISHQTWYVWKQGVWKALSKDELRAKLNQSILDDFIEEHRLKIEQARLSGDSNAANQTVRKTSIELLNNAYQALSTRCFLTDEVTAPSWLEGSDIPLHNCLFAQNGTVLLDRLVEGSQEYLLTPTPLLFNTTMLPIPLDMGASPPTRWLQFLNEIFEGDQEAISTLQDYFGYCLVPDTRQQKMLTIIGQGRSGKGTISSILTALVGPENTANPTLGSLADPFGLAPLMGKSLAVIGDAQLSKRDDRTKISETLKGIVGEDPQSINRKHQSHIECKLGCRFVLLSNEVPDLIDVSGTVASRMIFLRTRKSFLGNEDIHLKTKLMSELPGILLWSIYGWQRLREIGHFRQPESGLILQRRLRQLASMVAAFVQDRCEIHSEGIVPVSQLYQQWCEWCETEGDIEPGDQSAFGRRLKKVLPGINKVRPRSAPNRERCYQGIRLRETSS